MKDGLREWSYGELETRSNQLGRYLRAKGVGPEVRVGLCVGRGVELVLGALGVMKAGGAYVALDPDVPGERLGWMLRDSGARVVVTQEGLVSKLDASGAECVRVDGDWERIGKEEERGLSSGVVSENLAYVIYTSGSTGVPKGVELTHGGLRNLVEWHCGAYGLGDGDRGTQVSGLGFDASVWELWPYLASGGSVHLVGEEDRGDPRRLKEWLVREGITVSFLPTPLAEAVLEEEWGTRGRLRLVLTGGRPTEEAPARGSGLRGGEPLRADGGHGGVDGGGGGGGGGESAFRSGARSGTCARTCWTGVWSRWRRGCGESCTSGARGWDGGTRGEGT